MPRILLVEDNELNREMLSRRLVRKGFEVVLAVDGLQGVAMAASARPDLVLMDMSLPGIDGWEATRRLRAAEGGHRLPVIALTAHAMSDDRAKALAAGCDDFDTKPVDLERLLGKIHGLLSPPAQLPTSPSPPPPRPVLWATERSLPATPRSLPALQAALDDLCARAAAPPGLRDDLQVVLDEVCANLFEHAYPPGAPGLVHLGLRHLGQDPADPAGHPAALELSIVDQGRPFNPLAQPAPALSLPLEERPQGGLGIHLVRSLTDSQHHSHSPAEGNRLTLIRHLAPPAPPDNPTSAAPRS